jgi:hypothetical protein
MSDEEEFAGLDDLFARTDVADVEELAELLADEVDPYGIVDAELEILEDEGGIFSLGGAGTGALGIAWPASRGDLVDQAAQYYRWVLAHWQAAHSDAPDA